MRSKEEEEEEEGKQEEKEEGKDIIYQNRRNMKNEPKFTDSSHMYFRFFFDCKKISDDWKNIPDD